jgi:hypothetical protein
MEVIVKALSSILTSLGALPVWRSSSTTMRPTGKDEENAERKRIEAMGISSFQAIAEAGISEQLRRWKGIETTERVG